METKTKKYQAKYWNNKGDFQTEYDGLFKILVPDEGEASTEAGELLRAATNLYYDHFNNGDCNRENKATQVLFLRRRGFTVPAKKRYSAPFDDSVAIEYDELVNGVVKAVINKIKDGLVKA
jgi:hypothetical protein